MANAFEVGSSAPARCRGARGSAAGPRWVLAAALAAVLAAPVARAAEADFPRKAVTMVVPFPAGGTTDINARAVAPAMSRNLGQNLVIDNKGGAGGTIGAAQVLRAEPDGHTLLFGTPADQVNAPVLMAKPPYDPARDFAPVGCISRSANVLVVNPKTGINDLQGLVRFAKANPGKLNYGSAGNGNTSHLSGELLALTADIDIQHVPYKGNAPAITDTIGGQVQMMFSGQASVAPHIKRGTLKAIAVTSSTRMAALPDVPTMAEAGVPVEVYSWSCLLVPAATPPGVVARLSKALGAALEDPATQEQLQMGGSEIFRQTPAQAKAFIEAERVKWTHLIRTRKISAD